jgi:hypothetical protein
MNFTLLPIFFLLASLAAVQSHLTGLCTSSGGEGVAPGVGRVWLLCYHVGASINTGDHGYFSITPTVTGVTQKVKIENGCDTSKTSGSPADKILGCPGVPKGANVTCYMNRGSGENKAYTGDDTRDATIYSYYNERNAGLATYADITLATGSYKMSSTGVDIYFADYRGSSFSMQTERGASETFNIVMKGTVALTVSNK